MPTQGLDEPLLAVKRGLHAGDTTTDAIFPIVTDGRSQLVAIADSLGHIDNSNATTGFHQGPWGSSGTTSRAQTFGPARWAVDTGALGGISSFRNRQYDPGTGRWLQEDPAGLGGGVNLYQYNGNNPASFSDPFGLDPCKASSAWTECIAQALANWGASTGGLVGGLALNAGAALNAGLDATGINAAASAGNAIGSGNVVVGAASAALAIVPGVAADRAAVGALIRDATENPGGWKTLGVFVEQATGRKARGGISIQRIIENAEGRQLAERTLINESGDVIEQHLRGFFKPQDQR
ncbi:MAG TPA: RHS repeat-associated core domain-containing protein [Gemmatimonadales bacterium]|nr:RHS repeat-associated core domain-containing protein [Gemmatimonadales bacterium]